jgi:PAS domain S-box-containing protein
MHGSASRSGEKAEALAEEPRAPREGADRQDGWPPSADSAVASIESLDRIINCIADPIFVKDDQHRLVLVNDAECALAGRSREELLGGTDYDILPAEQREIFWQQDDQVIETGEESVSEDVMPDARGQPRTMSTRKTRLVDAAGQRFVVGVIRDITERKRAEQRLASLAAAVEQAADDIVVTDVEGTIRYVNSAFERSTGYSFAEAAGRSLAELLGEDPRDALHREARDTLRAGRPWQGRLTARTKDGRLLLQDANVSAIRDNAGWIVGYAYARRDVTRQVETERRAAQAEKLEAIGTLAGGIAHDFNNILSAIVGYAQMAQMKSPPDSPIRRDLQAILNGSRRATELIKQILIFSRQEEREEKPVRVAPLVEEATQFLRASIPTTIEIRRRIESDAVVLADPTDLHRIVINLCTNAALAMSEGGGVLEVGLQDVDLDAASVARHDGLVPGRHVRLSVSDTGCGMRREVVARIFEPFFTTREFGKGTGLGLATVHGIVKRCHGAITVESEPGKGSRFEIYLPATRQNPAAAPGERDEPRRGTERVLVVDDDPPVAEAVAGMLRALGYTVRTRTSSLEALAAFEANPGAVDLVITDLAMPGLTGDVLAQRLKRIRPDLPVVLCTGYSETISAEMIRAYGIDGILMKPVVMAELSRFVRQVLEA